MIVTIDKKFFTNSIEIIELISQYLIKSLIYFQQVIQYGDKIRYLVKI